MSYDVAVWEGTTPRDDAGAAREFEARYRALDSSDPPTVGIRRFVDRLLARYPDVTTRENARVDDSPWADGPLIANAAGSMIYLGVVPSAAYDVLSFIAETAQASGLIAFDPQTGKVLTRNA